MRSRLLRTERSASSWRRLSPVVHSAGGPPDLHTLQEDGLEPGEGGAPTTLLVAQGACATLLVSNVSRHRRTLPLPPGFIAESVRVLNEDTAREARTDSRGVRMHRRSPSSPGRLELEPFATARLDGELTADR